MDRVEEIRGRLAAATPGPWWVQITTACYSVIQGGDRTNDGCYIAMMGYDYIDDRDWNDYPNSKADAELIANAPKDIDFLLRVLDSRTKRLRQLEVECDDLVGELRTHNQEHMPSGGQSEPSITCPRCNATSYNTYDIQHGYCGNCHWWTSHPTLGAVEPPG